MKQPPKKSTTTTTGIDQIRGNSLSIKKEIGADKLKGRGWKGAKNKP